MADGEEGSAAGGSRKPGALPALLVALLHQEHAAALASGNHTKAAVLARMQQHPRLRRVWNELCRTKLQTGEHLHHVTLFDRKMLATLRKFARDRDTNQECKKLILAFVRQAEKGHKSESGLRAVLCLSLIEEAAEIVTAPIIPVLEYLEFSNHQCRLAKMTDDPYLKALVLFAARKALDKAKIRRRQIKPGALAFASEQQRLRYLVQRLAQDCVLFFCQVLLGTIANLASAALGKNVSRARVQGLLRHRPKTRRV